MSVSELSGHPVACPHCGAPISAGLLAGLCPHCVARLALAAPAAWTDPPRVRYFGDYELLEEIGRGSMGVVFKARQVSLNRLVAVKMLLHGDFSTEESVRRFHTEAEAAASLQHPNIVAIHEIGVHEGRHYFSMDFVEGQTLSALADGRLLPARQAARYLQAISEAVHHAHQHGVLHRDLKPANIIIDARDQPRITDFGLAKRLDRDAPPTLNPQLTCSGQVLGAPSYMPPEQAAGKQTETGVPSDVYAIGAILYHLLTGRPPFLADTLHEILRQVQDGAPPSIRALNPALPRDLQTICLKCLRKAPRERYPTAAALAEDLRRWLNGEPILARPPGPLERVLWLGRRHPALATACLAALMLVVVGIGFWVRREHQRFVIPSEATELLIVCGNEYTPPPVYVTTPDGAFWRKFPLHGMQLDVSPDGRRICYECVEGSNTRTVCVSRLDGGGETAVVPGGRMPRWLDNETILFQPPDMRAVWAIDLDTGKQRKLFDWASVTPNGFSGNLAVSPDRTRLLCNPQNGAWAPTMDVFICDLDGQNVQVVWEDDDRADRNAGTADESLVWLGTNRVAWCRHARPGNRVPDMAIVACELGQTNLQALTGWHGFNYPLAASPDGRRLLFVTEDTPGGGNLELWTMSADGTDRCQVADHKFSCDVWMTARWVQRPPASRPRQGPGI